MILEFGFLLSAYLLSQFYRSFLAVLAPVLIDELGVSATDLSYASAAWFIVFALAQFPIGAWLDRFGPRRTASILLAIGGGGGIALFAAAASAPVLIIAMGFIGLGCAPVLMASFFLFTHRFSDAKFASLAASFVGLGTLGNVLGSEPLAAAIGWFGWRPVGWGLFVITIVTAVGIFLLVRDPENENISENKGSLLDLIKVRELWFIFPIIFMGYGVAAGIRGLWAGPYLADIFGFETTEIGRVTLYMALALVAGSFAYGPLDRIFSTRKWVVFTGNAGVLVALFYLLFASEKKELGVTFAFVAIGFFGSAYAVQMAHGKAFVPSYMTGRGVTLLNFFSIGGAGLMQSLSGLTVEGFSQDGALPASGYHALFLLYAVSLGLALLVYMFSTDAKPGSQPKGQKARAIRQ